MFCASDEHSFYGDGDSSDDDDGENAESDLEEIESALYAQIHFHHEEEDKNLSFQGYSTYVQTLGGELTQGVYNDSLDTLSESFPSGPVSASLLPQQSNNNYPVSVSSEEDSVYVVSDSEVLTDSDCMVLDETVTDTGDIMVHVESYQQPILQARPTAASEENDVWKISEMDQMETTNNPGLKRYYNPISVRCHNCKEMGHISSVCPKPKKSEICHLCGMTGHFFRKCPEGICYNCEGPGHTSRDCPQPRKQWRQTCLRCLMPGHSKSACPDIWRQFHVTTTVGPVQKREMKANPKKFCSNCASRKHFNFECAEDRMEKHENGNYPFISTYTYRDHSSSSSSKDKKSDKQQKTKNKNSIGSKNWDNMSTIQSHKGTKRKYQEDSDQHTQKGQGKYRKMQHPGRDDDTQMKSKRRRKKEKQASRNSETVRTRDRMERENYTQSWQGKHKTTQNKFNKGKKESAEKVGWQAYNPQHRKDRTNNFDRGFKTSYYQNKIPDYQNKKK